jgi:hypothetical protein
VLNQYKAYVLVEKAVNCVAAQSPAGNVATFGEGEPGKVGREGERRTHNLLITYLRTFMFSISQPKGHGYCFDVEAAGGYPAGDRCTIV